MKKAILLTAILLSFAFTASAQGVREVPKTAGTTADGQSPKPSPAPKSFEAQYQGGLFGFAEKLKGTLNFDDANSRLVFRNKENKEVFALPYKSLTLVQGSSSSYTPTGASIASAIPVPGAGLLGLLKSKHRYLAVQYSDPDSDAAGGTSFKVENKELLQSIIYTLGEKAELKQRGDAFYRPRETPKVVL